MLILMPTGVSFANVSWTNVRIVAVTRAAVRAVVEHTDTGPHAAFVDVPAQRTRITVTSELGANDLAPPMLGTSGTLLVRLARAGSDSRLRERRATAVVTAVSYRMNGNTAERIVEFEAVSGDGASDPLTLTVLD
jgi:hypothetical protein